MLFETENKIDIKERSPLALAFVGDAIYELLVRAREVETTRLPPNRLHTCAVKYVSAKGQFSALKVITPVLTESEQNVVRRGQNANKSTVSKNATVEEYRGATGFETLLGYLYLEGHNDRILELFNIIWDANN